MHPLENRELYNAGMKKNCRLWTEIEEDIKNGDLKNYLDFDFNGRYEFTRCKDVKRIVMVHYWDI